MVKDVKQATAEIIAAVGGKENIASATHCMTRLRLVLKDEGLSSDEAINKISGVISVVHAGGQVQVVIGQGVDKVYDQLCQTAGFETQASVAEEMADRPKEKLTPKKVSIP